MRCFQRKAIAPGRTKHQQLKDSNWPRSARPLSGYSWLLVTVAVLLVGGLWLFIFRQIDYEYERTIAATSKETMNLAKAYEEHVRRVVAEADKDLLYLKAIYEQYGVSGPIITTAVKHLGKDPALNQAAVCDEQGNIVVSFENKALATNIADREYFQFQRSAAADTLFIGRPIQVRRSGQTTIPLSRRINNPDGSFGGIVYIGLTSDYFHDYYKMLDLGRNQLLALAGTDGFSRIRQVDDDYSADYDLRDRSMWNKIRAGQLNASYRTVSLDGIARIVSYRTMPDYPLVVMVGIASHVAMTEFEKRKFGYIFGATSASMLFLVFGGLVIHWAVGLRRINLEMTRLDRLNIIGEMAASIGHEVRNPLTTVRGYLQHFGQKAVFGNYCSQLALMIEELDRANAIITEFLSLAKNKTVDLRPTDLNQIIQGIVPLMQSDALMRGNSIELELEDIPEILADDKEIRQAILNLVRNGLDASPKGGKVTIGTTGPGNQVVLTVRDQGPGILIAIIEKLGTPFFTTKENGTGLGLPVCYRIAQRHQATIDLETGPDGTAFHLIFNQLSKND